MKKTAVLQSDETLMAGICGTPEQRAFALEHIFVHSGWRETALAMLLRAGAAWPDAQDAVQEAMITLDRRVRKGYYDPSRASLKTYFIGICHGQFATQQRSGRRIALGAPPGEFLVFQPLENPESLYLEEEGKQLIRKTLERLETHCRELLLRYMLSFSMKEIRDELQIVSDAMTRKTAMNCRKKLFFLLENNPILKSYFEEK